MKQVNITELPLFSKDNINSAIRVAEVLYPDGVELYFPAGTYNTGPTGHIFPSSGVSIVGAGKLVPSGAIPFRRNQLISLYVPSIKPQKPQISWIEFLKSF